MLVLCLCCLCTFKLLLKWSSIAACSLLVHPHHHHHHHHPESSLAKQPGSVDKQCAVSVLTVFAEFSAVPKLAVFQLAVFAGGSMSALEGEGQPSRAGVEPAGCFKQGQGVISNQGRDFKLLATKMTTELF